MANSLSKQTRDIGLNWVNIKSASYLTWKTLFFDLMREIKHSLFFSDTEALDSFRFDGALSNGKHFH